VQFCELEIKALLRARESLQKVFSECSKKYIQNNYVLNFVYNNNVYK